MTRRRGPCHLCGRPLPQRRWWQWTWLILPPPPTCPLDEVDECSRLLVARLHRGDLPWITDQIRDTGEDR